MKPLKRSLAVLLTFALMLSIFTSVPAAAYAPEDQFAIGATGYGTLTDAVTAAQNGETVRMLADVACADEQVALSDGQSIALDLNGHTLSSAANRFLFWIGSGSSLTVCDSSAAPGTVAMQSAGSFARVLDGGTLTLADGVSFTDEASQNGLFLLGTGALTISNASISDAASNTYAVIQANINSTVTVSGGRFCCSAPVFLPDGNSSVTVMGGSFNQDVSAYLADGYVLGAPDAQGMRSVAQASNFMIGQNGYDAFWQAANAAQSGDTIKMMHDVTAQYEGADISEKSLFLDLNGHNYTITSANSFVSLYSSGSLTIGDSSAAPGTISFTDFQGSGCFAWVLNNASLTLQDGITFIDGATGDSAFFLTGGSLTVTDAALSKSSAGTSAIIQAGNANPSASHTTVATIQLSGGTYTCSTPLINIVDLSQVRISGGTFTCGTPMITSDSTVDCTITGGVFNQDVSAYLADGYQLGDPDAQGYYTAAPGCYSIGQNNYATLREAVNAAQDNDVICVTDDCNETLEEEILVAEKRITLDVAGCELFLSASASGAAFPAIRLVNATLSVINSAGAQGKLQSSYGHPVAAVDSGSQLILSDGVQISCTTTALEVEGSVLIHNAGISCPSPSATTAFKVNGGAVTIEDGSFSWINGIFETQGSARISISGGTFDSRVAPIRAESGTPVCSITGGRFNQDVSNYLAADYKLLPADASGYRSVALKDYVAQVGEVRYETFAEAVAAAQNDYTITLLADIDEPYTMAPGQTFEVFKGNYALTVNPPEGNYAVDFYEFSIDPEVPMASVYTVVAAVAAVNGTKYGAFRQAVEDAQVGEVITLLANIAEPYTMTPGQSITVKKGSYTLTVDAPQGNFIIRITEAPETPDDPNAAILTTYTVGDAVAKINETFYATFAEAVAAAQNDYTITLLADIDEPYTMAPGQTFEVFKGNYALTVNPPEGNYAVDFYEFSIDPEVPMASVYTVVAAVAAVNGTKYGAFWQAVEDAQAGEVITLLANIAEPYTMTPGQSITVKKGSYTLTVDAPQGNFIIRITEAPETPDDPNAAILTTYTAGDAVARINETFYATFAEAVAAAQNDYTITLLTDIADPYVMMPGQTMRVIKDGHNLTVSAPAGNYVLRAEESQEAPIITTYSAVNAVASVNGTLYATFEDAVNAAGTEAVTLLADIGSYTLPVGRTVHVNKNSHSINVLPPEGYLVIALPAGIDTTIYSLGEAYAEVNGVRYGSFEAAVNAANGAAITLLRDCGTFRMSDGQTIRVNRNSHALTLEAPSSDYFLDVSENNTLYVCSLAPAKIDDTLYRTFSEAATASKGTKDITLLKNMDADFHMSNYNKDILRIKKNGFTAKIKDAVKTRESGSVTIYMKTYDDGYVDGIGMVLIGLTIGAGTAALCYLDNESAPVAVTMGAGSELVIETASGEPAENVEATAQNPEEQCIQRESENGKTKLKSINLVWITLNSNIPFTEILGLDAMIDNAIDSLSSELYSDILSTLTNIISQMPSVKRTREEIDEHIVLKIKFPYPKGLFFPNIPILHFVDVRKGYAFLGWSEDHGIGGSEVINVPVPYGIGHPVTSNLELTAQWYEVEAKTGGTVGVQNLQKYPHFSWAADHEYDKVISLERDVSSAYTLPAGRTLQVKKDGFSLTIKSPEGYALKEETNKSTGITTYSTYLERTVTFQYNHDGITSTAKVPNNTAIPMPKNPDWVHHLFVGWFADPDLTQPYVFSTPITADRTIYAKWTDAPTFAVEPAVLAGGTVTPSVQAAYAGDPVTLTVTPAEHYALGAVSYSDGTNSYEILPAEGVYSFTMPAANVTVTATFVLTEPYVVAHSLSLNGDIGVNFYTAIPNVTDAAVAEFTVGGETRTVPISLSKYTVKNGEKCYKFSCPVHSPQIDTTITAVFRDGQTVSAPITYSVSNYLTEAAANPETAANERVMALMRSIATYGYYANVLLDYNPDFHQHPLFDNSGMAAVTADSLAAYAAQISDGVDGVAYQGSSLVLRTETAIRHYFRLPAGRTIDDFTFLLNGDGAPAALTPKANGGYYYVEIPDIASGKLGTAYTVTVADSAGETVNTWQYSALSYVSRVLTKAEAGDPAVSNTLADVSRALTLYFQAADAYFSQPDA